MIHRILEVVAAKEKSVRAFSKKIGFPYTTLNNYIKGVRKTIDSELLIKIASAYVDISIEWLLTGKGSMVKTDCQNENQTNNSSYSLYYYTTAETLLKILGDASVPRIRYSNFNNTNDPKERTLYYRHYVRGARRGEKTAKECLSKSYRFISFCKQPESCYYTIGRITAPRMWAQYGTKQDKDGKDNKSYMNGACIELDFKSIVSKAESNKDGVEGLSFFDIEYKNKNDYSNLYYSNDSVNLEDDARFKYEDWSEEQEFRALYKLPEGISEEEREKDEYNFLDISGCIRRIYLGADFRHENVAKLCCIMASKRYADIDPSIFTRIIISKSTGLLENVANSGGDIVSDMLEIIARQYPKYFNELLVKNSYNDININGFKEKLAKEREEDEEKLKLDVEHWKNEYILLSNENKVLYKEKDKLNEEIKEALKLSLSLKDRIEALKDELGEVKNDLAEGVVDVITVLTGTDL
jgi:hypothetical protein